MEEESPKTWFEYQLRKTLNGLYDPNALLNSPLPQLFNLAHRHDAAPALRRLLTDAIESLRPTPTAPLDSQTWRVYQILRSRYTEQLTQQQVACNLGLSVRQLQRSEKLARQVLTDYLWSTYNLIEPVLQVMHKQTSSSTEDENPPSMAQELEWLQDTVPAKTVSFLNVLNETIEVLAPLMQDSGISTIINIEDNLPEITVKTPLLRQALLNTLNTAVHCCRQNSPVEITATTEDRQLHIRIHASCSQRSDRLSSAGLTESISMAQRLIELCQGHLILVAERESEGLIQDNIFEVIVTLPTSESIDVLVVDDNADVLQLFERYLAGSRYRFRGTQNPHEGLQLAEDMQPGVVVLDVMMPGRDGWTLLGQLREHPITQDIPVIVCSILSQEQFALALGAAGFIRKPVNRQAFLEVLDQQFVPPPKESG